MKVAKQHLAATSRHQANALMVQARAMQRQEVAHELCLAGLQRIEAAVATTPLEKLHKMLGDFVGPPMEEAGFADTVRMEELENPVQAAAIVSKVVKSLAKTAAEKALIKKGTTESRANRREYTIRAPIPMTVEGEQLRAVYVSHSKPKEYYCPLEQTNNCFRGSKSNDETINSHIRRVHTFQKLCCPNEERCTKWNPLTKLPFTSTSMVAMREHYRPEWESGIRPTPDAQGEVWCRAIYFRGEEALPEQD